MEIIFYSHSNETHFHKKSCAPSCAHFESEGFWNLEVAFSNPLRIKHFVSGISISFECECQIQHTKNLNPRRFELGTILNQLNRSIK